MNKWGLVTIFKSENSLKQQIRIIFGVHHGSVLGPIGHMIYSWSLMKLNLPALKMIDNTLHDAGNIIEDVILSLQESSKDLFKCFSDNKMQDSSGKCRLILRTDEPAEIQVWESLIKITNCENWFGIKIYF